MADRKSNGHAQRKLKSWTEAFVSHTKSMGVPENFRRWAAICAVASILEQKVWLKSAGDLLYPNLYCILIGHPGTGKTRTIRAARSYLQEVPEFHIAPISLSAASLVDAMMGAKRMMIRLPDPPLEYNSMLIAVDELGTFVSKYDDEMIALLSSFYDIDPYTQRRRTKDINIKIQKPQLSILAGSTPSNLLKFVPEGAWDQGFMSRMIMVFSDERIVQDDFANHERVSSSPDLLYDLKLINTVVGEFKVTEDYRNLVNLWRGAGELPAPSHPKLLHYNTRRRAHLYKLSMVSAVDRSNTLLLTREDFNTAMNWLVQAEAFMPEIFKAGAIGADASAMEEIYHFVLTMDKGKGVSEHSITNFAQRRLPIHSVTRVYEVMERSGMIRAQGKDRFGVVWWRAVPREGA